MDESNNFYKWSYCLLYTAIAWHGVSYDFQVAVVVCSAFPTVNLAIAVLILELDVARALMELTQFQP